jgi:hypothetical protein
MTKGKLKFEEAIEEIISQSNILVSDDINLEILKNFRTYKHKEKFFMVFGFLKLVSNRINKIKNILINVSKANERTNPIFEAFINFKACDSMRANGNIIFDQHICGVHAEMQLLGKIVDFINNGMSFSKDIYIGISKKCCYNCNLMIGAFNSTSPGKLLYQGCHDGNFSSSWKIPKELDAVINNEILDKDNNSFSFNEKLIISYNKRVNLKY